MFGGVRLKVSFTHKRSCFCYINPKYSSNNEQVSKTNIIKINFNTEIWVFDKKIFSRLYVC